MPSPSKASQEFVPVQEVRDGIAILKDGGMRAVLLASSVNFALKSPDEQEAIIFQFQSFLNTIDFSVQIFIQSRRLDIRPYLATLEARYKEQQNDLMKIQTREYIDFIKSFTESTSIMKKSFFVVVPYSPAIIQTKNGALGSLFGRKTGKSVLAEKTKNFEENRTQLEQRISIVEQGLVRAGVRSVLLGTEEVVELFYKLFNPGDSEKPIHLS